MFAVNKLLKQHKSSTSMSSENSSPWNSVPAASASPKTVSPWAVSPFQTSNPFKSPETSSSLTETEPEPDVVSSAVIKHLPATTKSASAFSAAFELSKETEEPIALSVWTMAPIAKAEETVSASGWTSAAPDAAEQVKQQEPLAPVEESIAPVEKEVVTEEMAAAEEEESGAAGTTSARTSVPVQEAAASAWTMAHFVKETAVVEKAGAAVVAVSTPVEPAEETLPLVVDEIVVPHKEEKEESFCAASAAWTTASVKEASSNAWTSALVLDEVVPVVVKVEADAERPVVQEKVVEPVVETAAVEEEAVPVKIVTPELAVATLEPAEEKAELVTMARKPVAEPLIEQDGLPTGAWNSTSVQEEVMKETAPVKEEPTKQELVELDVAPVEEIAAFAEAEKVAFATVSAWSTTLVQEITADEIETIKEVKPIQEPAAVEEVTKEAPVAAVKDVLMATELVVENGKVDKKAIANAFDGVASYKFDSVSKAKKIPTVEAAAAKSADAPGACGTCGVGGCSIQ
ncbi:unnamed protein product [Peronospora destructor]|uniref:Uncharacterized protein n=1 Tax=Peronospora destructor TaxID=86335 RepID=A0AAV0TTH8_9STRA|nr:unnamed protein product [Peronospora destructor]